jgi:hypothetical protein
MLRANDIVMPLATRIRRTLGRAGPSAHPGPAAGSRGAPSDSRILIIHCDDLGMAHSINRAAFQAFEEGAISSASVMVPCPWFAEVAEYANQHASIDLGIHLTLTSQSKHCKWRPIASKELVPSLIDSQGYFLPDTASVARQASPQEVEREMREQIECAMRAGVCPTHLDHHMWALGQTPSLCSVYNKLADAYGLPSRTPQTGPENLEAPAVQASSAAPAVTTFKAPANIRPHQWSEFYESVLRSLKPGINELIVHLGYNAQELRAITRGRPGWDAAWRQRDFDVICSRRFRRMIAKGGIRLAQWREVAGHRARGVI